ncbi:flagellin [Cryobacterium sp. CG_9.6]|uniref:flagellin N-terminal helical domain-containing protein n=1 Tax=Cryobacterium sp. CG_9.6 TaxID=2760710 RepID=UPI0024736B4F|nr:flagellin [Cryobacterium sp. CG_9.6]MDH6237286.1 flagellin [Cryobacterium sp. CG_9.6]
MGMQVNTNIAANNAYRNLATTQNDLSKSLEKLSSGLRINRAADDAAGLAISEGLKSQVGGLTVASRNAQDAISVIQTAEGSLNEVTSILQRMRDLAVQAGNDSNSDDSRAAITTEVGALRDELTRISESTNFNGRQLLDGSEPTLSFQIGANDEASSRISVDMSKADLTSVVDNLDFTASAGKNTATALIDYGQKLQFSQDGATVTVDATVATNDVELATLLNQDASFAQNFSASTNDAGSLVVSSNTNSTAAITVMQNTSTTPLVFDADVSGTPGTITMGFGSASAAKESIEAIDLEIKYISTARAELGANQNRFESVIKNLAVSRENLTAAGSRIRDTDMAEEMVKYTRANILSQAGTAMLAQANQSNQGVLQLLR